MLHAVLHGDLASAARYNAVTLLMLPVLVWAWLVWSLPRLGFRAPPTWRPSSRMLKVGLALWMAFAIARNLPWAPFNALWV